MKMRRSAAIYFALQGIGVLAWWALLVFAPASRRYFMMGPDENVLLSFWLPDLFLLAAGSLVAARLAVSESEFLEPVLWFVTGAVGYAALYCLAYAFLTDSGWLGTTLMLPAMLWSGVFAVGLTRAARERMFRINRSERTGWILFKTFAQIVVVWTLILVVFPYLIVLLEDKLGIPRFAFPFQTLAGIVLFVIASVPGVWGAVVMSRVGRGTPLPLDHAAKLVVRGPYAYVRNPMAVSGIGQGLAVALLLGSMLVSVYALTGALIWQVVFRELEEADLHARFGREYEEYRRRVRCWIPRLRNPKGS